MERTLVTLPCAVAQAAASVTRQSSAAIMVQYTAFCLAQLCHDLPAIPRGLRRMHLAPFPLDSPPAAHRHRGKGRTAGKNRSESFYGVLEEAIELERPPLSTPPGGTMDCEMALLLGTLGPQGTAQLLRCMALETSVVLLCPSEEILPAISRAALALLWPMQWQHAFVPAMPQAVPLECLLQSPCPFFLGVDRNRGIEALGEHVQNRRQCGNILVVDIRLSNNQVGDATGEGHGRLDSHEMPRAIQACSQILSYKAMGGYGPRGTTSDACTLYLVGEDDDDEEIAKVELPRLPSAAEGAMVGAFKAGAASSGVSALDVYRSEIELNEGAGGAIAAVAAASTSASSASSVAEMAAIAGQGLVGRKGGLSSAASSAASSVVGSPGRAHSSSSRGIAVQTPWCWRDEVKRIRLLAARTREGLGRSHYGRAAGGLVAPVGTGTIISAPQVATYVCSAIAKVWLQLIGDYDAFLVESGGGGSGGGGGQGSGASFSSAYGADAGSPGHAASSMDAVQFSVQRAVSASSPEARPFLRALFYTQSFAGFLDRQTKPGAAEDPDAALVDAMLDANKGARPRLLADAEELGHCTTTVVLPPMSATVESAEALRSASEEGSVARLAVVDVSLEDVLRCDAIETALDTFEGRRAAYPDTLAEEAAALRARVGEDVDSGDGRGRAMTGDSVDSAGGVHRDGSSASDAVAASRRRKSRAISRRSMAGGAASGRSLLQTEAGQTRSAAGTAVKASLGWFARLFGAAGRAESHRRSSGVGLHGPRASLLGDLVLEAAAAQGSGAEDPSRWLGDNSGGHIGNGAAEALRAGRAADGKATWSTADGRPTKGKLAARRQRLDLHRARRAAAEILARTDSPGIRSPGQIPMTGESQVASSSEAEAAGGGSAPRVDRLVADAKVLQAIASPLRARPAASRMRLFSPDRSYDVSPHGHSSSAAHSVSEAQLLEPDGWLAADRVLLRATLAILRGEHSPTVFKSALNHALLKCSVADVQAVWLEARDRLLCSAGSTADQGTPPQHDGYSTGLHHVEAAYLAGLVTCNHLSQVASHLAKKVKYHSSLAYLQALPLDAVGPAGTVTLGLSLNAGAAAGSSSGTMSWSSIKISASSSSRCPNPTCGLQGNLVQQIRSADGLQDASTAGTGSGAGLQHRCPSCGTPFSPRIQVDMLCNEGSDSSIGKGSSSSSSSSSSADSDTHGKGSTYECELVSSRSLRLLLERVVKTEGEQALLLERMATGHPRLLWNLAARLLLHAPMAAAALLSPFAPSWHPLQPGGKSGSGPQTSNTKSIPAWISAVLSNGGAGEVESRGTGLWQRTGACRAQFAVGSCRVTVLGQTGSARLMDAGTQHCLMRLRREAAALRGRLEGLRRTVVEAGRDSTASKAAAAIAAHADRLQRQCRVKIGQAEGESRRLRRVIEQLRGCVRVVARVRPQKQLARRAAPAGEYAGAGVDFLGDDALGVRVAGRGGLAGLGSPGATVSAPQQSVFDMDRVLRPDHGQETLWQEVDASVERVLGGGTSCVLCYGYTGSGKTYSMVGGQGEHAGVQPRSIRFLLDQMDLYGVAVLGSQRGFEDRVQWLDDVASGIADGSAGAAGQVLMDGEPTVALSPSTPFALVTMSALEIYNERIRDLGAEESTSSSSSKAGTGRSSDGQVSIRMSSDGEVIPVGACWTSITTPDDAQQFFNDASRKRATADNGINAVSSRSHLVVLVRVAIARPSAGASRESESKEASSSSAAPAPVVKKGKLVLVDLAGSERLSATGLDTQAAGGGGRGMGGPSAAASAAAARLKEAYSINKSLSALGNVVAALATADQRTKDAARRRQAAGKQASSSSSSAAPADAPGATMSHIPYRDSLVTRLLQDCLGGSASTTLVVAVSPDPEDAAETQCTMQFAQRARAIKSDGGASAAARRGARGGAPSRGGGASGVFSPQSQRAAARLKQQLYQTRQYHEKERGELQDQVKALRYQLDSASATAAQASAAAASVGHRATDSDMSRQSLASSMDFKVLPAALVTQSASSKASVLDAAGVASTGAASNSRGSASGSKTAGAPSGVARASSSDAALGVARPVLLSSRRIEAVLESTKRQLQELRAGSKRSRGDSFEEKASSSTSAESAVGEVCREKGTGSAGAAPGSPSSELASRLAGVLSGASPRSLVRLLARAHAAGASYSSVGRSEDQGGPGAESSLDAALESAAGDQRASGSSSGQGQGYPYQNAGTPMSSSRHRAALASARKRRRVAKAMKVDARAAHAIGAGESSHHRSTSGNLSAVASKPPTSAQEPPIVPSRTPRSSRRGRARTRSGSGEGVSHSYSHEYAPLTPSKAGNQGKPFFSPKRRVGGQVAYDMNGRRIRAASSAGDDVDGEQ